MVGQMGGRKNGRKKGGRTDGWTERRTGRQRERITQAAIAAQMNSVRYAFAIIAGKCVQKRQTTLTTSSVDGRIILKFT